jgi:hypothetical protein
VVDLNNALLSYILTGYDGFTSAAGYVGPHMRVDHDISLLVPEIWCRMFVAEREPKTLIESGALEKVEDFTHKGRKILAGRLGYRITRKFVRDFLGRIFNNPDGVFPDEMLKPELQDMDLYARGVEAVVEAQERVAKHYFADGSVEAACPPLKALLHVMAKGSYEGKDVTHPDVRRLFTREAVLASDWYKERLRTQQSRDAALQRRHVKALETATASRNGDAGIFSERLARARAELKRLESPAYLESLTGTLGADPFHGQITPFSSAAPAAAARPASAAR